MKFGHLREYKKNIFLQESDKKGRETSFRPLFVLKKGFT